MRVISFGSILNRIINGKRRLCIVMVLMLILFVILGINEINNKALEAEAGVKEYEKQMELYNKKLQEYEDNEIVFKNNLKTTQEQYDTQQAYCNQSIYMQLDSNAINAAEIQYQIDVTGVENAARVEYVVSALVTYIGSNSIRKEISTEVKDIPEEYLREIISVTSNANNVSVLLMHYDEEKATILKDSLKKAVQNQSRVIRREQGDYNLNVMREDVGLRADINVLNTQSGAQNALKNYATAVNDIKKAILSNEEAKENYMNEESPEPSYLLGTKGKIAIVVKYCVLAMISVVLLLLIWEVLAVIFGKRLLSVDYFLARDIPVLDGTSRAETDVNALERVITDIFLTMKSNGWKSLYFDTVSSSESTKEQLLSGLKTSIIDSYGDVSVSTGQVSDGDVTSLKAMAASDMIVLTVRCGHTLYDELDRTMAYITRYQKRNMLVVNRSM